MQAAPGYATNNFAPVGDQIGTGDGGCDVPGFNGPGAGSLGNCVNEYQGIANQLGNEWILSGKVDYNMSDKDHLSWRYRMDHGTQPTSVDFFNPAFAANSF